MKLSIDNLIAELEAAKAKGIKDVDFTFFVGTTKVELAAKGVKIVGRLNLTIPEVPRVTYRMAIELADSPENGFTRSLPYAIRRTLSLTQARTEV